MRRFERGGPWSARTKGERHIYEQRMTYSVQERERRMTREDGQRERKREKEHVEKAAAARGRLGQRGEERSRGEEEPK